MRGRVRGREARREGGRERLGFRVQGAGFRVQGWGETIVVHEQDAGEGGVEGCPVPRVPRLFREGSYLRLIDFCITQL